MTDLDRVALDFFRNLMRLWGCSPDQQLRLLGCGDRTDLCELARWQARGLPHDALLRISHLMGIHRALRSIFGDNPAAYDWVSRPNDAPPFAGRAAMELLVEGRFEEVREYLVAVSGKTLEEILDAKRRQQQELIEAIQSASTEELETSAEKIRAVMRASKAGDSGRQRMAPPPKRDD